MSEAGWHLFLQSGEVDDWAVLHGSRAAPRSAGAGNLRGGARARCGGGPGASLQEVQLAIAAKPDAAVAAGGRIVDDSHAPEHWTLTDRAGNRVCICAWPDGFTDLQE